MLHAGGVADAEVVVRTEGDAGDGGHLGLIEQALAKLGRLETCLLYTSPSPRDRQKSRMPSSA